MSEVTVNRQTLVDAMKMAMPGIDKGKTRIEGADSFIFDMGIIYSYNHEVAISVTTDYMDLKGTIKAQQAFKLFSKLTSEELIITVYSDRWEIEAGNAEITLRFPDSDCMDFIDQFDLESEPMQEVPTNLHEALYLCSIAKNKTDHEGIAFMGDMAMSTDVRSMAFFRLTSPVDKFWITEEAAKFLRDASEIVEYRVDPSWVHFKLKDETYFSARRKTDLIYPFEEMKAIYTKYKGNEEIEGNVFPDNMDKIIDRIAIVAESYDTKPIVDMVFTEKHLIVKGESSAGTMQESVEWAKPFEDSNSTTVMMDSELLKESIKKAKHFYFFEEGDAKALIIEGENFMQFAGVMVD